MKGRRVCLSDLFLSVRVYTFPCLTAFLESTQVRPAVLTDCCLSDSPVLQLFPPKDEQLDHFWIDFNISSECVSFFVDNPQVQLDGLQSVRLQSDGLQSAGGDAFSQPVLSDSFD